MTARRCPPLPLEPGDGFSAPYNRPASAVTLACHSVEASGAINWQRCKQGGSKDASETLQGCFRDAPRMLQGCSKDITPGFNSNSVSLDPRMGLPHFTALLPSSRNRNKQRGREKEKKMDNYKQTEERKRNKEKKQTERIRPMYLYVASRCYLNINNRRVNKRRNWQQRARRGIRKKRKRSTLSISLVIYYSYSLALLLIRNVNVAPPPVDATVTRPRPHHRPNPGRCPPRSLPAPAVGPRPPAIGGRRPVESALLSGRIDANRRCCGHQPAVERRHSNVILTSFQRHSKTHIQTHI